MVHVMYTCIEHVCMSVGTKAVDVRLKLVLGITLDLPSALFIVAESFSQSHSFSDITSLVSHPVWGIPCLSFLKLELQVGTPPPSPAHLHRFWKYKLSVFPSVLSFVRHLQQSLTRSHRYSFPVCKR